jgi:DNA-binding transcriptional LysR family regulator
LHSPSAAERQALSLGVRKARARSANRRARRADARHTGLMVEATIQGLGIAYVPERAVRAGLDDGRLVMVLDDWCPSIPGLCLYYPGHRHVPAGLRAFIEVLKDTRF